MDTTLAIVVHWLLDRTRARVDKLRTLQVAKERAKVEEEDWTCA